MISLSLLVLLLGADDCVLNEGVFKSQLDSTRLSKGARIKDQGRKDRVFRETLEYSDGTSVTLQVSGCAHLGLSVELRSKKLITSSLTPAEAVKLLTKTLGALPMIKQPTLRPGIFLDALKRLKTVPEKFPVPLQCNEFESCELQLDTSKEPVLLALYDFPL
ncbi:MAG: hypothetical protein Q8N23_11605 [Archangium sp.]|nr:hypothetical protein [Archangium sp.]MDP3573377.1 hypothetical protein [Archangium sp.]